MKMSRGMRRVRLIDTHYVTEPGWPLSRLHPKSKTTDEAGDSLLPLEDFKSHALACTIFAVILPSLDSTSVLGLVLILRT